MIPIDHNPENQVLSSLSDVSKCKIPSVILGSGGRGKKRFCRMNITPIGKWFYGFRLLRLNATKYGYNAYLIG